MLARLVFPELGDQQIGDIKRIVRLLDKIEDERGPQAAHQVLAFLGMRRVTALSARQLCDVWDEARGTRPRAHADG